jgi:hypothetical protein
MLSASEQNQLDQNGLDVINPTRLIGQQDQIIIAGLCRGIDTSDAEKKAGEMRLILEGMKAQGRKLRQRLNIPESPAPSPAYLCNFRIGSPLCVQKSRMLSCLSPDKTRKSLSTCATA